MHHIIKNNQVSQYEQYRETLSKNLTSFLYTFTLRGTYTGKKSAGVESNWRNLNTVLDTVLQQLSSKPWNGYKTVTAYFTNY
ncbi:TPA: hypothetical protein ACTZ5W_005926 [Bacillus cereus]